MLTRRVLKLFDLLVGLVLVLQFLQAARYADETSRWAFALLTGLVVLAALTWTAWRRTGARWLTILFALATFALSVLGGGGSMAWVILLCLALALLTVAYGTGLGMGTVAALALVVAGLTWTAQNSVLAAVGEGISTVLLLGLGVVMGQVLRDLARERERNAALVDEVRRSALVEQELALAEERARSARELHDGLGHQLTLVVMGLQYTERMRSKDQDMAFAEVTRARETAVAALDHMRKWVRALNPPRSEQLAGAEAFDAIADSFRGTGLDVVVRHSGTPRPLDKESSLFAVRMVQEGLTNVLRHSGAQRADLEVGWEPDALQLEMRDDGGATARGLEAGFGLRSMAERAKAIGGTFTATAGEGGVVLTARVPTRTTHLDPEGDR